MSRRSPSFPPRVAPLVALVGLLAAPLGAAVEKVEVLSRQPLAGGASFGAVGAYEEVRARVHYALDPNDPANTKVIDLALAPQSDDGKVRFAGDLVLMRPVDPARGNGSLLVEIPNRGGKALIPVFHRGVPEESAFRTAADYGDAFLFQRGFTLAWVGWQSDVPTNPPGRLRLDAVPVRNPGASPAPITGLARADAVFNEDGVEVMPLGHRNHLAYPVANPDDSINVLTVRGCALCRRNKVPRDQWRFARLEDGKEVPDPRSVYLPAGFEKGAIYELVYLAGEPVVVGLGLTAVRDAVAFLRSDPASPAPGIRRTLTLGISQSGRFLRHFLYQGFNQDERGKPVFDGVWAHAAGAGRGSFNHRFAQPSRDAQPYSSFFYPTDLYPFADTVVPDNHTGARDGLLTHAPPPKVFFTNTSYEYWGRAASLLHTDGEGKQDVAPGPTVRIYHFAGTQHFVGDFPPRPHQTAFPENPVDQYWSLRALLIALDAWVATGKEPPATRVPRIDRGELMAADDIADRLYVPGFRMARDPLYAARLVFGPRFERQGIIDQEPPRVLRSFATRVPNWDEDGNDTGGVRLPEVAVPVATYTGWNWRPEAIGAAGEMADFRGAFLPFPRTAKEAKAAGDPRRAVKGRYKSRGKYLKAYEAAARALAQEGFLLAEDVPAMLPRARELWDLVLATPPAAKPSNPGGTR